MSEHEKATTDMFKKFEKLIKNIDGHVDRRVDNKVNAILLKYFGLKMQILAFVACGIIASIAVHVVVLTYVNDRMINSSLKVSMAEHSRAIADLRKDMKTFIKVHNDRKPKSVKVPAL